jgi:hypothetical protein
MYFRSNGIRSNGVRSNGVSVKWCFGQKNSVKGFFGKVIQNRRKVQNGRDEKVNVCENNDKSDFFVELHVEPIEKTNFEITDPMVTSICQFEMK